MHLQQNEVEESERNRIAKMRRAGGLRNKKMDEMRIIKNIKTKTLKPAIMMTGTVGFQGCHADGSNMLCWFSRLPYRL